MTLTKELSALTPIFECDASANSISTKLASLNASLLESRKSPEFHERALHSSPSARHGVPLYNTCLPVAETSPNGSWLRLAHTP